MTLSNVQTTSRKPWRLHETNVYCQNSKSVIQQDMCVHIQNDSTRETDRHPSLEHLQMAISTHKQYMCYRKRLLRMNHSRARNFD